MNKDREVYSLEALLELLAEEKEAYGTYLRLCERWNASPDPIIMATSTAKVQLLKQILDGKLKIHSHVAKKFIR